MLYFAFGSNLSIGQMRERCPGCEPAGPALLRGRELGFSYRSQNFPPGGAADVVDAEGAEVWGALYRLTADDLESLDRFEHVGNGGYQRVKVEVNTASGLAKALCYEVTDRLAFEIPPTPEYRRLMLEGSLENGLPDFWTAFLEQRFAGLDGSAASSPAGSAAGWRPGDRQ